MYNIPRYQTGSYIPGLESQIFGAKLDRSIADTQEDLRNKSKKMQKGFLRGKIGKFLGKGAGKWLGSALTKGIAATNPLMALALKSAISSGTQRFGEKLLRGKDVNLNNKSGLLGSQYEDLDEYQKGIDKSARGAAWETFGDEIIGGLKSDYGKQIWGDQLSDDFKTKVFGENIASKSHEELSKMNIGEMLGAEGKLFGAEEKLSDIGENIYGIPGQISSNIFDKILQKYSVNPWGNTEEENNISQSGGNQLKSKGFGMMPQNPSNLYTNRLKGNVYQEGGEVQGYQEGGITDKLSSYLSNAYMKKLASQDPKLQAFVYGEQPQSESVDLKSKIFDIQESQNNKALQDFSKYWSQQKYIDEDSPYAGATITDIMEGGDMDGMEQQFLETDKGKYSLGKTHYGGILPSVRNIFSQIPRRVDKVPESGYQEGGMAYPLQMAGGGYMPEQGFGGLIQYRKGY